MTEPEWQVCTEPRRMLEFLEVQVSGRKLRLFAIACCRRVLHAVPDPRNVHAVEIAERYADGLATAEELQAAHAQASAVRQEWFSRIAPPLSRPIRVAALMLPVAVCAPRAWRAADYTADWPLSPDSSRRNCELLREVFGNPFRPAVCEAAWLSWNGGAAVRIAERIYEECRFEDLPVLADVLEEAGCTSADLLAHCRGPGEHVRGCWAVDLILGLTAWAPTARDVSWS